MASNSATEKTEQPDKPKLSRLKQVEIFVLLPMLLAAFLGMVWGIAQAPAPAALAVPTTPVKELDDKAKGLIALGERLRVIHQTLKTPLPGDWLSVYEEPGQTFIQYLNGRPIVPDERRRIIYIQPVGKFEDADAEILKLAGEFLSIYFDLPAKFLEPEPLSEIPAEARRVNSDTRLEQLSSEWIIDRLLIPRTPDDAMFIIALTKSDLWPGREGWNFVFGQASLQNRAGVWSIHRMGDPNESPKAFRKCLRQALKTASHESGHMFGIKHCIAYECNMNGCNSLYEAERHPLWMCPECHAKIAWAIGFDPVERFRKLGEFCARHGLELEQDFYETACQVPPEP
jgi:archaemetzincin